MNPDNSLFVRGNYVLLVLLAWVEDIYNLCNSFGEYPRVIFVANFG